MIMPVGASTTSIFGIPETTSVIFPTEGGTALSNIDYGPLNIPGHFQATGENDTLSQFSVEDPQYNLITFETPIQARSEIITLPIMLYGTRYTATLERITFKDIDDGVYSYIGKIDSLEDSSISRVVTNTGLFDTSIKLNGDYILVTPVQNRKYTQRTAKPLRILFIQKNRSPNYQERAWYAVWMNRQIIY